MAFKRWGRDSLTFSLFAASPAEQESMALACLLPLSSWLRSISRHQSIAIICSYPPSVMRDSAFSTRDGWRIFEGKLGMWSHSSHNTSTSNLGWGLWMWSFGCHCGHPTILDLTVFIVASYRSIPHIILKSPVRVESTVMKWFTSFLDAVWLLTANTLQIILAKNHLDKLEQTILLTSLILHYYMTLWDMHIWN